MSKKKIIYICVCLLFAIYMLSANYIFNVSIKVTNEAKLVSINLPAKTGDIKMHFDQAKEKKSQWKDILFFKGWAFKKGMKKKGRELFLVLESAEESLVFDIENDTLSRKGVRAKFKLKPGLDKLGFKCKVSKYLLKEGPYKIGLLLKDDSGSYYTQSKEKLSFKDGLYSLVGGKKKKTAGAKKKNKKQTNKKRPSKVISKPANLKKLKKPTKKTNYHVDKVNKSGNTVNILGWGFLDEMNAKNQEIYVLLKHKKEITVLATEKTERKDIAKHFNKTGVNLGLSGFKANISKAKLKKGRYRIGLYITNGEQVGKKYSKRYITID